MPDQLARSEEEQCCVEWDPSNYHRHLWQSTGYHEDSEQQLDGTCKTDEREIADIYTDRVEDVEGGKVVEEGEGKIGSDQLLREGEYHERGPHENAEPEQRRR